MRIDWAAAPAAVRLAPPDLAVDGGGAHGLFGAVVGRVDAGELQESEQLVAMFAQMFGQPLIVRVGLGPIQHAVKAAVQSADGDGHAVGRELPVVAAVAEGQGFAAPGRPLHGLTYARGRHADCEQCPEVVGDLAVRQAGVFVQVDDGRLRVGLAAGNLAVGLGAVVLAGLASRRGGRVFGRPLGERGGLTLVGAQDFLELRAVFSMSKSLPKMN
jgi:hypothetical protein